MVTLTHDAQSQLARYLRQMRTALRGHRSVDPDDIERDVRSHIDAELIGRPEPIDEGELQRVLDRLGAPNQWAPVEEQSPWWGVVASLRDGPEDWRLAYLSLLLGTTGVVLFMGGPFLWPLPMLLPVVAFLMARATLELLDHHDEPIGARRWLIYPVLLPWAIGLAALLLLWPLALVVGATTDRPDILDRIADTSRSPVWAAGVFLGALALGLWWTCLGLILRRAPGVLRFAFRPFADDFDRRQATRLAVAGAFVVIATLAALATIALILR